MTYSKRRSLTLCALLAMTLLIAIPGASAKEKPLNIVLVMADDVGFECFSANGSKEFSTPRLDALAAGGIRFENCHSTPLCTPSRVNLMSGKSNVFNYFDFGVHPKGEPTFANHFKKHGYATAVAGKWQLLKSSDTGLSPTEAGFDTSCLWSIPGTKRERYWNPSLMRDGKILELPEGTYGPDVATDFLIEFIEANKDKPFLAYYPMILPHNPFPPTPDSADPNEKDGKKNFIDMVRYVDKCVGRIVDTLEANGLRENTLVIFTADNGTNSQLTLEFLGKQFKGGKGYTRDHGTHVPLIANLPGRIPKGQINSDLICFSDFFPTIVEAAGLPAKMIADGDGWSYWPQCQGQAGKKREWIYGYYFPRPYSSKFDDKYNHWEVRYARDKRYKLYDNGCLYDTVDDVLEKNALAPDAANKKMQQARKKLQKALDAYPTTGQGIDHEKVNGVLKTEAKKKKK